MHKAIPDNLISLWKAEDELMTWAKGVMLSEAYLSDHMDLIEAYMDCVEMVRRSGLTGERFTAVMGLFMRTFDSMSHCVRAALTGNYTGSAMYARDLLETEFLLDYLLDEDGRPEVWLTADPDTIKKRFSPRIIRDALDMRDGYRERKRQFRYQMLSTLGAHPTPLALNLKRDGTLAINLGPFKHEEMLKECVQEAARSAMQLGGLLVEYCATDVPQGRSRSSRLSITLQRTYEKYFAPSAS